ncbi:MAG: CAP domain-containing protein [Acidobacteria bacterium]|nr:CAP domain-containing protein [Acidobacteriota bacterium]MCA1639197.1 CAP domain-containing protein [Acidobacteriota bacterium]
MKNKIFCLSKVLTIATFFLSANTLCSSVFAQKKETSSATKQTIFEKNSEKNSVEDFWEDEDEIFRLVNLERRKRRLNELDWDEQLAKMARKYSEKMARENFFSHFDPEGGNAAKRAKKAKIKNWSKIGENLFTIERVSKFEAFVVKYWMESPTHEENILDEEWTTTGVGIFGVDNGDIFITQIFIKR